MSHRRLADRLLLVGLLASACATSRVSYQPTLLPIPPGSFTPASASTTSPTDILWTVEPAHASEAVELLTTTATPIPYRSIPSGNHLLITEWEAITLTTRIISTAGQDFGVLSYGTGLPSPAPKAPLLAYPLPSSTQFNSIEVWDLIHGSFNTSPRTLVSSFPPVWSPSLDRLAISDAGSVEILDLALWQPQTLVDCEAESWHLDTQVFCIPQAWSPDGKWIVFQKDLDPPVPHARAGLFLMDASCAEEPTSCPSMTHPILTEDARLPTWSPDSRNLAAALRDGRVVVLDTATWSLSTLAQLDTKPDNMLWSPDGAFIAFSGESRTGLHIIGLISPVSGEVTTIWKALRGVVLSGWISVH